MKPVISPIIFHHLGLPAMIGNPHNVLRFAFNRGAVLQKPTLFLANTCQFLDNLMVFITEISIFPRDPICFHENKMKNCNRMKTAYNSSNSHLLSRAKQFMESQRNSHCKKTTVQAEGAANLIRLAFELWRKFERVANSSFLNVEETCVVMYSSTIPICTNSQVEENGLLKAIVFYLAISHRCCFD